MWRPLDDNVRESIKKNVTDHLQFGALHRHNVGIIRRVLRASEEPIGPVANGAVGQKVPVTELVIPPRQVAVKRWPTAVITLRQGACVIIVGDDQKAPMIGPTEWSRWTAVNPLILSPARRSGAFLCDMGRSARHRAVESNTTKTILKPPGND
jgi:hypothetical protein